MTGRGNSSENVVQVLALESLGDSSDILGKTLDVMDAILDAHMLRSLGKFVYKSFKKDDNFFLGESWHGFGILKLIGDFSLGALEAE